MLDITDKQALCARKHFGAKLHNIGVKDIRGFSAHNLSWKELGERQSALHKIGKDCPNLVSAEDDERTGEVEAAFDAIMALSDEITEERDHRTTIGSKAARSAPERHDPNAPYVPRGEDGEAHPDGFFIRSASRQEEAEQRGISNKQSFAELFDSEAELRGLDLGRYLRSMAIGGKTDVERRALAEGSDSSGGYTVPTELSSRLIDLLRAKSVVNRAGARTVPMTSDNLRFATVASDPVPAWRNENAVINDSEPTFGAVDMVPRSLAVLVKTSRELLEDSNNIATALPNIIAAAMAVEVDRVCLFGSGTPPEPKGLVNVTGINTIAHNAKLTGYAPLVSARTKVLGANAAGIDAYIMSVRDEGTLAGLTATDNQPLNAPSVVSAVPFLATTAVPTDGGTGTNESTIITGAFDHLLIGMRQDIRIEILRERYADYNQYAYLVTLRMDVAVEHAAAFTTITGIKP